MSITVSLSVYANGANSLHVGGVKSATINENLNSQHTRCLDVEFYSTEDLQTLQNELNYRFPENVKTMQEMPTEEGYYITQTGTLLYCDGAGDWSVRRPTLDDGKYGTEPLNRVWSDGLSALHVTWPLVVSTFGAGAFPLVPVKFAY